MRFLARTLSESLKRRQVWAFLLYLSTCACVCVCVCVCVYVCASVRAMSVLALKHWTNIDWQILITHTYRLYSLMHNQTLMPSINFQSYATVYSHLSKIKYFLSSTQSSLFLLFFNYLFFNYLFFNIFSELKRFIFNVTLESWERHKQMITTVLNIEIKELMVWQLEKHGELCNFPYPWCPKCLIALFVD